MDETATLLLLQVEENLILEEIPIQQKAKETPLVKVGTAIQPTPNENLPGSFGNTGKSQKLLEIHTVKTEDVK
mgnify:CR=1 FL=1